jgi:uncharacterized protein YukE
VRIKYQKMMTPSWLKNKGKDNKVRFGTEVEWNDVELFIPADTRFNETVFQVPLVPRNDIQPFAPFSVRIVAALEYRVDGSFIGGTKEMLEQIAKNTNAIAKLTEELNQVKAIVNQHTQWLLRHDQEIADLKRTQAALQQQIANLQSQIAAMSRPWRDPLCVMISGSASAAGFELRDPADYSTKGPYRGVEGLPGMRGLLDAAYLPTQASDFLTGVHVPSKSGRWPQVFRMHIHGEVDDQGRQVTWGAINSDLGGGHGSSFRYAKFINPAEGLLFTVFRGERNEAYRINYFEVTVFQ